MLLYIRKTSSPIKKWTEDLNRDFSKQHIWMANKHHKRYLALLLIRKMQIKTTMKYHLNCVRMVIIKKSGGSVKEKKYSCIDGGNVD